MSKVIHTLPSTVHYVLYSMHNDRGHNGHNVEYSRMYEPVDIGTVCSSPQLNNQLPGGGVMHTNQRSLRS